MWLGRFVAPLPIRCRGAFHVYTATQDGEGVTVVVAADPLPDATTTQCLARLALAHDALRGIAGIATVREHGVFEGQPFVSFVGAVLGDGEALVARFGETRTQVSHAEALTVIDRLSSALAAAHERRDPETGAPFCLGALGWTNVLVDPDGALSWLGFGHNVCALDETGSPTGAPSIFIAPEVAASRAATPAGDVYAFFLMQQALLPFAALPDGVRRAFAGEADDDQTRELRRILLWISREILGALPSARATLRDAQAQAASERAQFGIVLCEAEVRDRFVALLAPESDEASMGPSVDALSFASDGSWFRVKGAEPVAIDRRPARRLLTALLRARRRSPGELLSADALLEAGWPGERPLREAGLNRVYVALSALRRLGLRDLVERRDEGYRLDPRVAITVEPVG